MRLAEFNLSKYPVLDDIEIPKHIQENWQLTVDMLAEIASRPAVLIMRTHAHEIEVFTSSNSPDNVYHHGERLLLNIGLYCETVMSTRRKLMIPNALKDPDWAHNPDIKLGMISYCGFPLNWPTGEIFGTICIRDNKENAYSQRTHDLLESFRDSIQLNLTHIYESSQIHSLRDAAENLLRESELKFRTLAESMPQIVWITDANGKNIYFNQQWVDYTGLSLEESYGNGWIKPFHPDDRQAAWDAWQLAIQAGGIYTSENRIRRADGIYCWWLIRGVPLHDENGKIINWYGTCTDISAQKKTENSLRISSTAFETQESIMVTDAQGIIINVNQAFTKLTGYSEENAVGQPASMLKSGMHDALFYQAMWASIHRDGNWLGEIWDKHKNGEVFPARMLISAVKNPEGVTTHYVGSFLDNTLQKQTETSLLEAKSTADQANQAKSRFLAAASHDLRQPLAALSLYVDVLIKKNLSDDRGLGAKIQGCVNSLSELLNDLLDVSKLDAGVVTPTLSDFPINELLQAMLTMHSPEAILKGLRLHVRPSNWIGRTDFQIMQRILGNLVTNAIRYSSKGGILIGCRLHHGKQWIEVWDTGIGIPKNKTDSIFEEFTQLDDARNQGSGLGLAIVNKSAKLLGLQVRVRSRPGHGSMFAIEIPQGQAIPVEETPISKPPLMGLKIGLVDDNAGVLEAFTFALNSFGYEVIAATSGKELFEQLGNKKPDILISDYRLAEGMNGLDLVAAARGLFTGKLPAILITGDTDPEVLCSMAKHGVTVCHKPLKIAALEAVILELMKPK